MNTSPIPELFDPDRAAIQEAVEALNQVAQAANEFMNALVEALRPVVDAINTFVENLVEVIERWQVYAMLYRLRVPEDWVIWVSEKIPKFALPPISIPVIRWCLGPPVPNN